MCAGRVLRAFASAALGLAVSAAGLWVLHAFVTGEVRGRHGVVYRFEEMHWFVELVVRAFVVLHGTALIVLGLLLGWVLARRALGRSGP